MNRLQRIACIALAAFSTALPLSQASADTMQPETKEQRDQRMKWWREARFGMFIHWGLYAVPAGEYKGQQSTHIGEWLQRDYNIPVAEYAEYAKQFKPVKYDPDAWVKMAKDAGMKYIVITSKHHDGFALFDSKVTDYDVVDATPYKTDLLKPLAEACQKHGVKLGFYYSQAQDWHHPGGAAANRNKDKNIDPRNHWDKAQQGSMEEYIKNIAVPQVKEILTNYGPISVLWWDTPVDMTKELAEPFLPLLKNQPGLITNNRLVSGVAGLEGDTETPEQYIPATGFPGRDFEVCMTMNTTWGFKHFDDKWKSTETLVRNLIDIASKGGNYLLNVGPTAEGEIPQPSIERLQQIGTWMKANGDAVYGTHASPFRKNQFDGRVTMKDNKMFLHVFNWPSEGVKIVGIKSPVTAATVLDGGGRVETKTESDANGNPVIVVAKPAKTDPIATVVALEFSGTPEIDTSASAIRAEPSGVLSLTASNAVLNGRRVKLNNDVLGTWTDRRDAVLWDFVAKTPGKYKVELTWAVPEESAGSTFILNVGESKIEGTVASTGGYEQWKTAEIGTVEVGAGMQTLMIRPIKLAKDALMNLKSVKLTPAR